MTDSLNVGIIGAGRIGQVHAEILAYRIPTVNILAVSDVILAAADKQLHLPSWQDAYTSREEKLYHNDARRKYPWLVEKYVASIAAN